MSRSFAKIPRVAEQYDVNIHFLTYSLKAALVVFLSFPKGRNESCQSPRHVGLLHNRWRCHLSPPPQFRHGTGWEENILQPPAPVVSAATTHKTFGPTDLTSMYSVCTRRVFGGIGHRTQALRSGVRCSNPVIPKVVYMNPKGSMMTCKGPRQRKNNLGLHEV
ncbi:uncharacterized protein TNCV_1676981 [Trichonephila clavipes]|nr:uncharacterized protein TNCV_1676981 [Trichonephila clavipes]